MERIYLDHNATTQPLPEVVEAVNDAQIRAFGNPASPHADGRVARAVVDLARARVAGLLHADPEEIVFVSGGSEADALAMRMLGLRDAGRPHVVVSAIEHHAVLTACRALEAQGLRTTQAPPGKGGVVEPSAIAEALTDQTGLVAVMLANNDIGALQPVAEIVALAHRHGAWMHVDAVQAAGRIAIDFRALGADTLALSAHKLYGPKGVGALAVRRRPLPVAAAAWPHIRPPVAMPDNRHSGTINVPGVAGFGVACVVAHDNMARRAEHDRRLRDRLEAGLCAAFPGLHVNGRSAPRLPNTLSVSFDQADGVALAEGLDRRGLSVSTGAACSGGGPSHVLRAMGVSAARIAGSLRFSVGERNTEAEIDRTIAAVIDALDELNGKQRTATGE